MNLRHGRRAGGRKIDCIYFDKGLMRHFDDIFWCAVFYGARRVKIYGDVCQIPYIKRVAGRNTLLYSMMRILLM